MGKDIKVGTGGYRFHLVFIHVWRAGMTVFRYHELFNIFISVTILVKIKERENKSLPAITTGRLSYPWYMVYIIPNSDSYHQLVVWVTVPSS